MPKTFARLPELPERVSRAGVGRYLAPNAFAFQLGGFAPLLERFLPPPLQRTPVAVPT